MAISTIKKVTNTSGYSYCKMTDGTLIQWGNNSLTPVSLTGTQRGNLYYYECKTSIPFPMAFLEAPAVSICKMGGQIASIGWTSITKNEIVEVDFVNGLSSINPSDNFTIFWIAVGRWK